MVGYGKMGKIITQRGIERGHDFSVIVDPQDNSPEVTSRTLSTDILSSVDAVIDFSHPAVALDHLNIYAATGARVVMGTTGWYESLDAVAPLFVNGACIWSGNFSLGVNLLFSMLRKVAPMVDRIDGYDTFVHEYHHNQKADSPSGTAMMIGDILLDTLQEKDTIITDALQRPIQQNELHISSTRGGYVPGTHTITFDSMADSIEITHRARSREGFAHGALLAAEWIANRSGFFTIDQMMSEILYT